MFCIWEDDLRYLKRFIGVLDLYAGKVGRADGRYFRFHSLFFFNSYVYSLYTEQPGAILYLDYFFYYT
jgi:hypothetical protein